MRHTIYLFVASILLVPTIVWSASTSSMGTSPSITESKGTTSAGSSSTDSLRNSPAERSMGTVQNPGIGTTTSPPGIGTTINTPGVGSTSNAPGIGTTISTPGIATTVSPPGIGTTPVPGIGTTRFNSERSSLNSRFGNTTQA